MLNYAEIDQDIYFISKVLQEMSCLKSRLKLLVLFILRDTIMSRYTYSDIQYVSTIHFICF